MTEEAKRIRTAGVVPADYRGPIYWRLVQYYPLTGKGGEPIEFLDSRERQDRLWIESYKMPGKDIFTSGTVFDANGQVLPEWKMPLKAKWTNNRPVRVEYAAGRHSARVSERVYDAIQALEPGKHHAFPIDIIRSDGTTERRYELFFAQDALLGERELHPQANNLRLYDKPFGSYCYQPASWMRAAPAQESHFGYLDRAVVGDHQWFKGTDTNHIFSPTLFEKLQPFGDIFENWFVALPIGMAG
ncbi:hypothetical protein [Bradyrhizobium sp. SZCCHNPS1003]|uniref:hypothetical protein n=1 Tax=Bradyrhizobium sp. SZCCHNPS1003 TaxID=3057330 RepID=UPI0028E42C4A|nr:hypothetical protein [Bradyrhizobium sp. SZCCHNPS1003]